MFQSCNIAQLLSMGNLKNVIECITFMISHEFVSILTNHGVVSEQAGNQWQSTYVTSNAGAEQRLAEANYLKQINLVHTSFA